MIKRIKNSDLTEEDIEAIIHIKDQHWPYGKASQENWLRENLYPNDLHFLGYFKDEELTAYLNLVVLTCKYDGETVNCFGIGNVCVEKALEHSGYGKKLISAVNEYIIQKRIPGFLLCHKAVQPFYEKCGWTGIEPAVVSIEGKAYNNKLMILKNSFPFNPQRIEFDRNF